jgi:hypothetical protein
MVWVKMTDNYPHEAHEAGLGPPERVLHEDALCWIMRHDNATSRVTRHHLVRFSTQDNPEAILPGLLGCGWWVEISDGVWDVIHDVKEQRTHKQILIDRESNARRQADFRGRKNGSTHAGSNAVTTGESHSTQTRSRPGPVVGSKEPTTEQDQNLLAGTSGGRPEVPRPDVDRLCVLLADWVGRNGFERPAINKTWRRDMRLLLDTPRSIAPGVLNSEKRPLTEEHVRWAIERSQQDSFWYRCIRSPEKLRKQYDLLRVQAAEEKRKLAGGAQPQRGAMRGGARAELMTAEQINDLPEASVV